MAWYLLARVYPNPYPKQCAPKSRLYHFIFVKQSIVAQAFQPDGYTAPVPDGYATPVPDGYLKMVSMGTCDCDGDCSYGAPVPEGNLYNSQWYSKHATIV